MITIAIQLISKPEMSFNEAVGTIGWAFPSAVTVDTDGAAVSSGIVRVTLDQDALTDAQRDWLHLSPFSARYIDSYEVQSAVDIWQVHKDNEAAFCACCSTLTPRCARSTTTTKWSPSHSSA